MIIFKILLVIMVAIPIGLLAMKLTEKLMQDYRESEQIKKRNVVSSDRSPHGSSASHSSASGRKKRR